MTTKVDPWADIQGKVDYDKLIKDFGTEKLTKQLLERLTFGKPLLEVVGLGAELRIGQFLNVCRCSLFQPKKNIVDQQIWARIIGFHLCYIFGWLRIDVWPAESEG